MDKQKETERELLAIVRHNRPAWRHAFELCIAAELQSGPQHRAAYWQYQLEAFDHAVDLLDDLHDGGIFGPSDGEVYEAVSRQADPAAHDAAVAESLAVLDGSGDVVRQQLIEAGLTDKGMLDAVLGTFARLRDENLALHRRLAGETLRADLGWGRADSKVQECTELRERMATRAPIPRTPEQAIAFIGNQCEVREDAEQLDRVRFQLTAHDLLSAFRWWFDDVATESVTVTEKGPWQVNDWGNGRIVIQSDDFTHDVALELSGDFGPPEVEMAHAREIARRLNAHPVTVEAVAGELIEAADALIARWHSTDWKEPHTADFILRLTRAVGRAKWGRDLYTCIGKGGVYEFVGVAFGAGTSRDKSVLLYRCMENGTMYYRTPEDFKKRMQRVEDPA